MNETTHDRILMMFARVMGCALIASVVMLPFRAVATSPGDGGLVRISKHGISLTATGVTTLFTAESNAGRRFHPMWVVIEVTDANSISIAATVSVGTNDPDYNNVLAATALTGLTALNKESRQQITSVIDSVAPGTDVKLNVTVAATATACDARVDTIGFYE